MYPVRHDLKAEILLEVLPIRVFFPLCCILTQMSSLPAGQKLEYFSPFSLDHFPQKLVAKMIIREEIEQSWANRPWSRSIKN